MPPAFACRFAWTLALTACAVMVASASGAADLVVYAPDGPQDASTMVAAFGPLKDQAARTQGIEIHGHYFVQLADFQKFVESQRPGFGIVDPVYVLENREALGLTPLAVAQDGTGATTVAYCLAVGSAKPWRSVSELEGKSLAQTPLAGKHPYFVAEFLLESVLPLNFFEPKPVPHAASAVRAVELDESDAAFVPCQRIAGSKKLRVLFTSRPVPAPLLVAFGGAPPVEREKVLALFGALGADSPLLSALGVSRFVSAPQDFDRTLQAYRNNAVPTFDDLRISRVQGQAGTVVPSGIVTESLVGEMKTRLMPVE